MKIGTKVIIMEGELQGKEGIVANPLVVELICHKQEIPFSFKENNCVICTENVNTFGWFDDSQLKEMV